MLRLNDHRIPKSTILKLVVLYLAWPGPALSAQPGLMLPGAVPHEKGEFEIALRTNSLFLYPDDSYHGQFIDVTYALGYRVTLSLQTGLLFMYVNRVFATVHTKNSSPDRPTKNDYTATPALETSFTASGLIIAKEQFRFSLFSTFAFAPSWGMATAFGPGVAMEGGTESLRGDLSVPLFCWDIPDGRYAAWDLCNLDLLMFWGPEGGITWKLPPHRTWSLRAGMLGIGPSLKVSYQKDPWFFYLGGAINSFDVPGRILQASVGRKL